MKSVYVLLRREYTEDGDNATILSVHETLEGAKKRFHDRVAEERANYVSDETGKGDVSAEALEDAEIEEAYNEDPEGTLDWHIWLSDSWHELFIHIFRYNLEE